ncbi:MAG: hypothetical protein ACP5HS_05085 [Anaerolineae bacterium]
MMKIHVEVYLAAQALADRQGTFTPKELRQEIARRFGDTRSGVQTHISAHCVANAPKNIGTPSNYLWRLPDGRLRPFDPTRDTPHPSRRNARHRPVGEDLPSHP